MSSLASRVSQTLDSDGALAQAWPGFLSREGQREMAQAICETMDSGGALVVEAGTGVGKTFAYLVPVLLSGQRALLSTATKTLQDQLFSRDLPRLIQALNLPVRVALLKGRSSYLCLHRVEQARHAPQSAQMAWQRGLARVEQWAQVTRSGDLSELSGLEEGGSLWPWISSTRDNCLGSNCPRYKACHVQLARKEALAADIVVVNHHLFFADLAVRESGVAELLPSVHVTVFDEAHQLNEIGVNFLGQELSVAQLLELARDSLAAGLQLARGLVDWQSLSQSLETAARDWRLSAGRHHGAIRLRWADASPEGVDAQLWGMRLEGVESSLQMLHAGLDMVTELAPDFQCLKERAQALLQLCTDFQISAPEGVVRWAEVTAGLRLVQAPLDIAQTFARLTGAAAAKETAAVEGAALPGSQVASRAWIFTSATLGDDASLRWFTQPCGLDAARTLRVSSPFDYPKQSGLFVPVQMAEPGHSRHPHDVAQLVWSAARRLGGRTLVLTTTLQAMRQIGEQLQSYAQDHAGLQVLVQGQSPKRRLMERMREGSSQGRPGCILVASASFWEGFDVPGDALQLVVIDKLPFPPPDDPVTEARGNRLKSQGRSPFADLALPMAAVALKQGAGRLIRSEHDSGVLVVCDHRLVTKSYGARLLRALPPMRRLPDVQQFEAAMDALRPDSPQCPPGF